MKKLLYLCTLLTIFSFSAHTHAESIASYNTHIEVQKDGSLIVSESIVWDFEGTSGKRGIIREIPLQNIPGSGEKFAIHNFSVLDENGIAYNYFDESDSSTAIYKIGDPNVTVSGFKVYNIRYEVKGGLGYFKEYTELYFNIIGSEWSVPIINANASILLPEGVEPMSAKIFCGTYGKKEECATIEVFEYVEDKAMVKFNFHPEFFPMHTGYGATTAIAFERGYIDSEPTIAQIKRQEFLRTLINVCVVILPIFFTLFLLRKRFRRRRLWKKYIATRPIMAEYDAHGLSPAQVELLHTEYNKPKNISAEILWLVTNGYLDIERDEKGKVKFVRLDRSEEDLLSHQTQLLTLIGDKYDGEIEPGFYTHISRIFFSAAKNLESKGFFAKTKISVSKKIESVNNISSPSGGMSVFVAFFLAANPGVFIWILGEILIDGGWRIGLIWTLTCILCGVILLIFRSQYKIDYELAGFEAKWRILGLRHYINKAEKEKIAFDSNPEHNLDIAERLLPYAMVFGMEKKWIAYLEELLSTSGLDTATHNFHASRIHSLSTSSILATSFTGGVVASHVASTRAASRSSGSSSGSSGGGGGGGGGGSW